MNRQHTTTYAVPVCGTEVQAEIVYSVSPRYPATGPTWSSGGEPAGGGEVEIASVTLLIEKGCFDRKTVERIEAPAWLASILQDDDDCIAALGDEAGWGEPEEEDPDAAYERMRDDAMERNVA